MKNGTILAAGAALVVFAAIVGGTAAGVGAGDTLVPERDDWSELTTGAQVYRAACATCHGLDGRGSGRPVVGFDTPLPDFTDCSFASREPAGDWFVVAHEGGPIRGFDPMMPAFGGAVSDEQLEMATAHVKTLCTDDDWPDGEFNLPKALVTGKAFPEDEVVLVLESTVSEPVKMEAKFVLEKRIGARNQVELVVPVRIRQREYTRVDGSSAYMWGEGFGDLGLAWKGVLWHSLEAGTIGSLGMEAFVPLGDERDELSEGIFKLEPFLAIGQIIPGDNHLQLHAGAKISTDTGVAPHEIFWRFALGHTFTEGRFGRAWSPIVEILGLEELGDETRVEWSVVPELHFTLNRRQHVMMVLGARIPINEFHERQIAVMMSLLWDWFDGGFAEGW
jgi:mono/diheme cytochrome c family protein